MILDYGLLFWATLYRQSKPGASTKQTTFAAVNCLHRQQRILVKICLQMPETIAVQLMQWRRQKALENVRQMLLFTSRFLNVLYVKPAQGPIVNDIRGVYVRSIVNSTSTRYRHIYSV